MNQQKPALNKHKPVLMAEVLEHLNLKPNGLYVDVTLGGGGHTRMILDAEPTCIVVGMDWDKDVLESTGKKLEEEYPGRFIPVWGNFSKISLLLKKHKIGPVDGILADFGTSQIQIGNTPGLSVYRDAFLDMRMSAAHFKETAYDVINFYSEKNLADIIFHLGGERHSRAIAREIVEQRKKKRLKTTQDLVDTVLSALSITHKGRIHPATKTFQAFRIYVNKELDNIKSFLKNSVGLLKDKGRIVCISFHSLEDGIVKHFFREIARAGVPVVNILTKKVCTASEEELKENKSARSAKLRAIEVDK
jgi:16S rRNA (cytosine1402-N4)-methyltransferase